MPGGPPQKGLAPPGVCSVFFSRKSKIWGVVARFTHGRGGGGRTWVAEAEAAHGLRRRRPHMGCGGGTRRVELEHGLERVCRVRTPCVRATTCVWTRRAGLRDTAATQRATHYGDTQPRTNRPGRVAGAVRGVRWVLVPDVAAAAEAATLLEGADAVVGDHVADAGGDVGDRVGDRR